MSRDRSYDIAVTGVHARFPGAADLDRWWAAVTDGERLTTRLSRADLQAAGVPERLVDDPAYVPARGVLADADRFDHSLFQLSARDAELMDPQHRHMLEAAWAALEDAGVGPGGGGLVTGVYASDSGSGYLRAMLTGGPLDEQVLDHALHGTEPDFIASLVSYKLGLTGPSIGVRTACSSSLVGLHLAVQALLNGDCDQALVLAAGIDFPQGGYLHVPGGIQSESGVCRPFDAASDGVVPGSGVACVVLRRLADVQPADGGDGPDLYGVVLGTAVNNDGAGKAGYYAPSEAGQEAVIRAALHAADVDAATIGYLEAHATGTRVGDPIEWAAASAALAALGAAPGQVAVGALKATIGHLDAASGLAGLIKAMRVVKEGVLPPIAGFGGYNPLLDLAGSPLYVPAAAGPWTGPLPRRAGVSSFGIGGTNAHVVIEQPPVRAPARRESRDRLVVLSAADTGALERAVAAHAAFLDGTGEDLADVAYTLAAGRTPMPERLAVCGSSPAEVADRLRAGVAVARGRAAAAPPPVVLLLPGQGTQFPGMATAFAAALPGFTDALEECLAAFEPDLAATLRRALHDPATPAAEVAATALAQPMLFAVGYAAGRALGGLGVAPAALIGHSLGELTAACLTGVLSLPDAARVVAARGLAMQQCPPGAMLAVGCDEATARAWAAEAGLELAAVNGADSCVLAGSDEAVRGLLDRVGATVHAKVLHTSHAFHSARIEPALPRLREVLGTARLHPPAAPLASNLTGRLRPAGTPVEAGEFVEQARRPVRFGAAVAAAAEQFPGCVFVEAGPGRVLSALVEAAGHVAVPVCPRPAPHEPGAAGGRGVLTALGRLWTLGLPVPLDRLGADGHAVHLPVYQFGGRRFRAPEVAARAAAAVTPRTAGTAGTAGAAAAPPAQPEPPGAAPDPAVLMPRLWAELLGADDLDDDSDFFALGGDSLLVTQLARRLHDELGVRMPLRDMLAGRTLGRQTELIRLRLHDHVPAAGA